MSIHESALLLRQSFESNQVLDIQPYLVKYDGKTIETTVTNQGAVAEEWVSEILLVHSDNKNPVVGLDIKWDDSPDELVSNKCSVLLLCIETKCLILQLLYMDTIPETIKSFLMNSKFTFMGVNEVMSKLVSEYGLHCANTEDIRMTIKKPGNDERLNKWAARVLNEKQVLYACNLAYVSYKIAHTIIVDK
ncbi:Werner syndrome-like exonuclease, partial [Tanacetum coccineum]